MRGWRRWAGLLAVMWGQAALADTLQSPQADLYQEALQSIAEGRKSDASETLMRVIEKEPFHAGAYLEVALIQCSLGHSDEAERLFAIIETRFNPPQAILELIASAREGGCDKWQAIHSSSVMIARGHDRNVNQGSSKPSYIVERDGGTFELPLADAFLPRGDQYTVMAGETMREVSPNGTIGFAQFQARHHDHMGEYDSASLFAGVESPFRFGRWTLRTTAMVGAVGLGGSLYQRQLQLQARLGPPLPLPESLQFNLMGGITHTDFVTLTNFDADTVEIRGQFSYRSQGLYASASLGVLDDHARDARPGGNRSGIAFSTLVRRPLWGALNGELGYTRQEWDSELAYAPGIIDTVRQQKTDVLRAAISYPVGKHQTLQLEARAVRNKENISIFQYNNRLFQFSWQYQWP